MRCWKSDKIWPALKQYPMARTSGSLTSHLLLDLSRTHPDRYSLGCMHHGLWCMLLVSFLEPINKVLIMHRVVSNPTLPTEPSASTRQSFCNCFGKHHLTLPPCGKTPWLSGVHSLFFFPTRSRTPIQFLWLGQSTVVWKLAG